MFRIVRVFDTRLRVDALRIAQVQAILRAQFSAVDDTKIATLPEQLANPFKYRFRHVVFVAEDQRHQVQGFALVSHEPELNFAFLDFISAATGLTGRGVGGALYQRVREECRDLGCLGLFFECLPDDPALCREEGAEVLAQNAARLRFYERFGARPIVGTSYEQPMTPQSDCSPYLVLDPLEGQGVVRAAARKIVRAILERKYGEMCSEEYNDALVASIRDPRLQLREPRYVKTAPVPLRDATPADRRIALVVNDRHTIHHVREQGYVEAPARVRRILAALDKTDWFDRIEPSRHPDRDILAVHDVEYVDYLRRVCERIGDGPSVYPYVFPVRNHARPPVDLPTRAGYYCIDTFTPLNHNAWLAARRGVDCTLTAMASLLEGRRLAYALVRPPGHHAERRAFGGFCYLANAAIAAQRLSHEGRVAILDIDYHHGNGQQEIFYGRVDVLTVSLHGHPRFAYPYFTGFAEETGTGSGDGFNLNVPLPENVDGKRYVRELRRALSRIRDFQPTFLVVALGLDPAQGDPTGTWSLRGADFQANGAAIGELRLPTLVVQEGGYRIRTLGSNALAFFRGLREGAFDAVSPAASRR